MATKVTDSPAANVNVPSDIISKKKILGQQKREELEREVSALQKMLKQEEKVHEILDLFQNKRRDGNGISIPNFLPPKAKEVLAELAMVESEIIRLEAQIRQLQVGLKHEHHQINKEKQQSRKWRQESELEHNYIWSMPSPLNNERTSFETKALHFISKAIKGDYNSVNDFTFNDKIIGSSNSFVDHKENQIFHDQSKTSFQERIPRKIGMFKYPSPLRDPRHPSPKMRERNGDVSGDILPKSVPNAIIGEESNMQQLQPNKLSENIMKCLNFIYIRLLRTSRAMELEKSGPISRSLQASNLISRSYNRSDTNPTLVQNKESRQQDPYGIFYLEESIPRDIGPYKNLVIFTSTSLDPKCISSSSSIPLLRRLRVLMKDLERVELRFLSYQQKLAFWINMYNACIMHGFIQYGVPSSPEKLFTLIKKANLNIGGNMINAEAIEHSILRKSSSPITVDKDSEKDEKEGMIRKMYGLETMDPNVTFALCCGTRSSPAVKIYTGEGVIGELEKSKLEYLQASIIVTNTKRIAFPELLLRNMNDFASLDTNSLVEWVCQQLPTSGSLRKSIVDCFRTHHSGKITTISLDQIPFDFDFQYLLSI